MPFLITTQIDNQDIYGRLLFVNERRVLSLLEYKEKSYFSRGLSFIKQLSKGIYLIGAPEELLIYNTEYKPDIIGHIQLSGLVDIKDAVIGGNFIAVLSGLRDSVYIFNEDFKQIKAVFNVNKAGLIEFFNERQTQCQEFPGLSFFYCSELNNIWRFNRLSSDGAGNLYIMSEEKQLRFIVDLKNFSIRKEENVIIPPKVLPQDLTLLKNETVTDCIGLI